MLLRSEMDGGDVALLRRRQQQHRRERRRRPRRARHERAPRLGVRHDEAKPRNVRAQVDGSAEDVEDELVSLLCTQREQPLPVVDGLRAANAAQLVLLRQVEDLGVK